MQDYLRCTKRTLFNFIQAVSKLLVSFFQL